MVNHPVDNSTIRVYNLSSWPEDFIYIYIQPQCSQQAGYKIYILCTCERAMSMTLPSRLKPGRSYARSGWNGLVPLHYKGAAQLKTSKGIFYPLVKPLCIEWEVIIITRCMLSQLLFTYHYWVPRGCAGNAYLSLEKWLRSISCTATTLYLLALCILLFAVTEKCKKPR